MYHQIIHAVKLFSLSLSLFYHFFSLPLLVASTVGGVPPLKTLLLLHSLDVYFYSKEEEPGPSFFLKVR
jgi:hypothetical protein